MIFEWITAFLLVSGSLFFLVAAVGVVRFSDPLTRMHAATKAGTLGAGLMLAGAALASADWSVAIRATGTFVFLLITAPVAAHVVGRTVWNVGRSGGMLMRQQRRDR